MNQETPEQIAERICPCLPNIHRKIKRAIQAERDRAENFKAALEKINAIRNGIIGFQSINWSEHIYPLVAALNDAGIYGMDYPEAKANVGTLIERTNAAEARAEQAERVWKASYKADRDTLARELDEAENVIAPFAFDAAELKKLRHPDDSTCLWRIKAGYIRAASRWLERRMAAK